MTNVPDLPKLSTYREVAVGYIAGFEATMVARRTGCPECRSALSANALDGSQPSHGLVLQKDQGGLNEPLDSTVQICLEIEKRIQKMLSVTGQQPPRGSYIIIHASIEGRPMPKVSSTLERSVCDCTGVNTSLIRIASSKKSGWYTTIDQNRVMMIHYHYGSDGKDIKF